MNRINVVDIDDAYKVTKPWGKEIWLQPGSDVYPYALKKLILLAGCRTSLQVHKLKSETILILEGSGILLYSDKEFDCDLFLSGNMDLGQLKLKSVELNAGSIFSTPPHTVHRMIATTDLHYVEASTTELDDVIRLQDDSLRMHGRISNEHQ